MGEDAGSFEWEAFGEVPGEGRSGAEQDGVEVEEELVDEAGVEQGVDERVAGVEPDVVAGLLFEVADEGDGVV